MRLAGYRNDSFAMFPDRADIYPSDCFVDPSTIASFEHSDEKYRLT